MAAQAAADGGIRLLTGDPAQATTLLREAWHLLASATAWGVSRARTAPLEATIRSGLDTLYCNGVPRTSALIGFDDPTDVSAMAVLDGVPYLIAPSSDGIGRSVRRYDDKRHRLWEIVKSGDGQAAGEGIATPRLLTANAGVLLIVDAGGISGAGGSAMTRTAAG